VGNETFELGRFVRATPDRLEFDRADLAQAQKAAAEPLEESIDEAQRRDVGGDAAPA
jgi:hypothetical protein